MAMPSNSTVSLKTQWDSVKDKTGLIKNACLGFIAAASINRIEVLTFLNMLADSLALLEARAANAGTSGLLAYAQAQENDPALDLNAAYPAMRAQIVAVQDWIVANFPKDGAGVAAVFSFDGGKRFANVQLVPSELSAFKTQLANLSSTIQ